MNIYSLKPRITQALILSVLVGFQALAQDPPTIAATNLPDVAVNKADATTLTAAQALALMNQKSRIGIEAINQFYSKHGKPYAWIEPQSISNNANILKNILEKSNEDALNPNHYHSQVISALMSNFATLDIKQKQALDVLLTDAFLSYARDMGKGRPELKRNDQEWLLKGRDFNEVNLLTNALSKDTVEATLKDLTPKYQVYSSLKAALPKYQKLAELDNNEPKIQSTKTLELNMQAPQIIPIRARLIAHGFLAADQNTSDIFDQTLAEAVKKYQAAIGLDVDGKIGPITLKTLNTSAKDQLAQIEINMERWRWMPENLGKFYLVVDITGFEYFIVKDGLEAVRAKIVVGTAARPTPVFSADMNHIVFSPYWSVPNSIAVKDKLPMLRQDPYRLARSGIRVYDRRGNEIDPGMVDWENYNTKNFNYTLRQDPGANNALGQVKFMFPNSHAIYLHDTPTRSLFNKKIRTYSSGCIRVENPLQLAEYLLKDKGWDAERIKTAYNRGKENSVQLAQEMRLPVIILYMTTWIDSKGEISFRTDIYGRDAKMMTALKNVNSYTDKQI